VRPYRFLEPGRAELIGTAEHYETQAAGLGDEFLTVVGAAIDLLRENPDLGAPHRGGTRRFVLARFPYSLVYLNDPDSLVFVAVAHHQRESEYWITRL
jgi:toxin ParE1/3/4